MRARPCGAPDARSAAAAAAAAPDCRRALSATATATCCRLPSRPCAPKAARHSRSGPKWTRRRRRRRGQQSRWLTSLAPPPPPPPMTTTRAPRWTPPRPPPGARVTAPPEAPPRAGGPTRACARASACVDACRHCCRRHPPPQRLWQSRPSQRSLWRWAPQAGGEAGPAPCALRRQWPAAAAQAARSDSSGAFPSCRRPSHLHHHRRHCHRHRGTRRA
mmetsp:Transcript_28301/g.91635  ORF Transcript_28301/g.91635 Transcript_28301/m.91635 type:complete len:218 (-) Transcript_28301:674-1327(-)